MRGPLRSGKGVLASSIADTRYDSELQTEVCAIDSAVQPQSMKVSPAKIVNLIIALSVFRGCIQNIHTLT